ncbi:hypothetical protein HHI36_003524 [Cryptolaemus montrouzieri]|uniref:Ferric-chelate reductase 1 n=1 Tax=Cryptolaemus montrouzieri TaxID=559131 RepID=A0ABD2PE34_9CUCU
MLIWCLLALAGTSYALPQGAPEKVCDSMLPVHSGILPQGSASPYSITPRRFQGAIMVTLTSLLDTPFEGFMLQGRTPDGRPLGAFENVGEFAHTINCAQAGDTATHNSPNPKNVLEFKWLPPRNYEGPVIFNGTIAQDYSTFWVGVESGQVNVRRSLVDDPAPSLPSSPFSSTPPTFERPNYHEAAMDFDPFYTGCTSTKLCFGSPDGCVRTKSCQAAVAISVAGDKVDFELKATQNAAWVGVGLSDDEKMGDDSVIECAKNGNQLGAYLSWTEGKPNYGATRLKNQLGIRLMNQSIIDDTIYCRVRRDVMTAVNGKVFDLGRNKYHLLIASGSRVSPQGVGYHELSFLASGSKQALADVSEVKAASKSLIRLHGAFMLAAWIGAVSVGTLLARYFRQTWVGSSICGKDVWFAWHRMLMLVTCALTVAGFVLIWVELKGWSAEKNPHAILGTITTVLCILQPIGAFFRPHPGAAKRPLFNWLHWLGGNVAHILAIVTIFFAVRLGKAELPDFVDWILVGYVAFHVAIHLILSVAGCISERTADGRVSSFPMKDLSTGRNAAYMDRNVDAPYGGFRKAMLSIYVIVVGLITIALILITVLAPIKETWKAFWNKNS